VTGIVTVVTPIKIVRIEEELAEGGMVALARKRVIVTSKKE
jgi:hypothetical protein